jgi:hypothetical protein
MKNEKETTVKSIEADILRNAEVMLAVRLTK